VGALARLLEADGLSTVVVNMMPRMSERMGTPRTLAVEFPFGHPMGPADDAALQTRVLRAALAVLAAASPPGPVIEHFPEPWPLDFETWKRAWHPKQPSPIIRVLREQGVLRRA
jgi:D-proline reductase (dithiol) PrdB